MTATIELAGLTPAAIDTQWVEVSGRLSKLATQIGWRREAIEKHEAPEQSAAGSRTRKIRYMPYQIERFRTELEPLYTQRTEILAELEPFKAEWTRRGGWSRFYLVTNIGGHVHSSTHCTTCYPSTTFVWLVELAGKTEAEMVAEFGEIACTVCFPTAPSQYAELKARGLLTTRERLTQEEEAAKRAEKAAKASAKAAKAITAPDGTELRTKRWGTIRTLVTAQRELLSSLTEVLVLTSDMHSRGAEHLTGLISEYRADAERLVEAISAKTGETPESVRETYQAKAEKKFRKDYGG